MSYNVIVLNTKQIQNSMHVSVTNTWNMIYYHLLTLILTSLKLSFSEKNVHADKQQSKE